MYYELHITVDPAGPDTEFFIRTTLGWKYSEIDGDPLLGVGKRAYATTSFGGNQRLQFVQDQLEVGVKTLQQLGEKVVRSKIELVMVDNHHKGDHGIRG